ncbi:MAG: hypothetical protein ACOYNY_32420 [Caldilineaceae bacterium]
MYRLLKLRNLVPTLLILLCFYTFLSFSAEASALPKPTTGVMAQPTVPTPAPLITLTISSNAGNAVLAWTDNLPEDYFEVHRSTAPFFSLTANTFLANVAANTNTYVDTNSGIGNLNVNHFYRVRGVVGNATYDSNYVGEIDYPLQSSSGAYSMVGIPFEEPSPSDAAGLAAQIGNVNNIYRWNPNTQSFQIFTPPTIDNFSFTNGEALFVQVGTGAATSASIVGKVSEGSLTLHPDNYSFIAMPLTCDELPNAVTAAADITQVLNLLKWERTFQSFLAFTPPNVGDNFTLKIGDPFIVQLTANGPSSWPGFFTSNCK